MTKKKTRIVKLSVCVVALLLVLFLVAPYSVSAIVLHAVFDRRFRTEEALRFSVQDFNGLQAERHTFSSDGGNTLVGYRYFREGVSPKGLVVVVHGFGGGGQNGYLDVSEYFVRRGYEAFAYDATGNDESEGRVGGLEQGVIDLNGALGFVQKFSLPVFVWGHSWGGYAAICSLAFHSEIRAAASVSSFARASDMIEAHGVRRAGAFSKAFLPYVRSVERMKFGKYALLDGVDAVAKSTAGVFIAHGTADETVPARYGYDAYYARFSSDPRVRFALLEGKGHADALYTAEGWADTQAALRGEADGRKLCGRLNEALFDEIASFYDGT